MEDNNEAEQSHATEDLQQGLQGEANEGEEQMEEQMDASQNLDDEGEENIGDEEGEENIGDEEGEEGADGGEGEDLEEGEEGEAHSELGLGDGEESSNMEAEEEIEGEEDSKDESPDMGKEDFQTYHPDESRVRYILLKFINKMRTDRGLLKYSIDILGNMMAMEYADYLIEYISSEKKDEKKDPEEIKEELYKKYLIDPEQVKMSVFDSAIDGDTDKKSFDTFQEDFADAQATLIEYENDCMNILSDEFNQVGIGLAFNNSRLVVVNIFSTCKVVVESSSISEEMGNLILKGSMNDIKYGIYAIRIVNLEEKPKTILHITPQFITPTDTEERRTFTAKMSGVSTLFEEMDNKILELYIRERPESIPYNKPFTDKIKFENLTLGGRVPLKSFPSKAQRIEEAKQDQIDEEKQRKIQERPNCWTRNDKIK